MDTFELNKYAGAFLGALLVIFVINIIGNALVHPTVPEQTAIAIAVPETSETAAAAATAEEAGKPFAALLASADAASGEKQAKKCAACHTFEQGGANKIGPNLFAIVGRAKASADGFSYSSALRELGGAWTYEDLNAYLENPKGFAPGTKMAFPGIKKDSDRADVVAYLREQHGAPPPLPEVPAGAEDKAATAAPGKAEDAVKATEAGAEKDAGKTAKAEAGGSFAALLAAGDPANGEKQAKKCAACHTFEKGGANKIGPNLHGVVGRQKASVEGFNYSSAMRELTGEWTYDDLNKYLTKPKEFVPGTKMTFPGIRKDEDRADVILFLRQQSDSPPPLPSP